MSVEQPSECFAIADGRLLEQVGVGEFGVHDL
jgi:hypothetical protein